MKTIKVITLATLAASVALSGCATHKNPSEVVVAPMAGSGSSVGVQTNAASMNSSALRSQAAALANVIYFSYDSSSLSQADTRLLDQHVALLAQHSGTVTLTGHTDERGSREYNLALGERRAQAVQSYLVAHGVSTNNIQVVSYGEERPAVAASTEAAWAKNRRVELTY